MCSWKFNCMRITFFCQFIYLWSARITESYSSCDLVKRFPSRIIPRSSNNFIITIIIDHYKMCMSSWYNKCSKWRFQFRMLYIIGWYMPFYMMYSHKWFIFCKCNSFCFRNTHKQRSYKSRTICNSYSCYIIQCYVRLF